MQIAFFALQLPETERAPYTQATEHLLKKHRCLERMGSPDCRSRNSTIRFWESQYDVLIPENIINSPHGWTAWKTYGTWYLYLLTGKPEYLTDTTETLGSCAQLIDASGELHWPSVWIRRIMPDSGRKTRPPPVRDVLCPQPMANVICP